MNVPNIVLLVLDGVRSDRLSCYGWREPTSPTLDKLAGEGVLYRRNYSCANASMPAHIALFTGTLPSAHGAGAVPSWYDGRFPFLTELLHEVGYRTFGVSTDNPYLCRHRGFVRGFDEYIRVRKWSRVGLQRDVITRGAAEFAKITGSAVAKRLYHKRTSQFYESQDKGGRAIASLLADRVSQMARGAQPFFAFCNIVDAHPPFLPPRRFREMFGIAHVKGSLVEAMSQPTTANVMALSAQDRDTLDRLCQASVRYVDELVKTLFDTWSRTACLDNVVVFIMSDHGEMLFEQGGLFGHGVGLYEGSIKTPLIVWYGRDVKGSLPARGTERQDLSSIVDIAQTIMGLANIKPPTSVPLAGTDLFGETTRENVIVAEEVPFSGLTDRPTASGDTSRAIIAEHMKLIWRRGGIPEVYDLRTDPEEMSNLHVARPGPGSAAVGVETHFQRLWDRMAGWYARHGGPIQSEPLQYRALEDLGAGQIPDGVDPLERDWLVEERAELEQARARPFVSLA